MLCHWLPQHNINLISKGEGAVHIIAKLLNFTPSRGVLPLKGVTIADKKKYCRLFFDVVYVYKISSKSVRYT